MRPAYLLAAGLAAGPATAATVTITVPKLAVAEYHRPYVAAWIEPAGGGAARTLFVWYDLHKQGNEPGTKWLADLRTWWRKGGRSMAVPSAVSGATRAPGAYKVPLPADLAPGAYVLNVEAARETGGRELVSLPLAVPAKDAAADGHAELGRIALSSR